MTFFHAIILGIVEGITEFLPVSSTAHLEFAAKLLGIVETDAVKTFLIVIQLGAILAVVILFAPKFIRSWKTYVQVAYSFIPTAIIGFLLYKFIKTMLIGNTFIAAGALILGGIIFIFIERKLAKEKKVPPVTTLNTLGPQRLVGIGLAQALAVVPGVSRSGAIIIYGLASGISREVIVEFAFLLAIPTMIAASGYDLLKTHAILTAHDWGMIAVGLIVSCLVALVVIKWFIKYIQNHSFEVFGWYRIGVGILLLAYSFFG